MPDLKEEKKEIELFLRKYREDLVPLLSFNESPDGRIHLENGFVIGVEHTRIFQPRPNDLTIVQQQESIKNKIVEKAFEKYKSSTSNCYLNVVMGFEDYYWIKVPHTIFKTSDIELVSDEIVLFIKDHIPIEGETNEYHSLRGDTVPNGLLSLKIYRPDDRDHRRWARHTGGVVPLVQANHIQDAIDPKNKKVVNYRQNCNELWLILVINNIKYERSIISEQNTLHHNYDSDFDKTFIFELDYDKHSYYELNRAI